MRWHKEVLHARIINGGTTSYAAPWAKRWALRRFYRSFLLPLVMCFAALNDDASAQHCSAYYASKRMPRERLSAGGTNDQLLTRRSTRLMQNVLLDDLSGRPTYIVQNGKCVYWRALCAQTERNTLQLLIRCDTEPSATSGLRVVHNLADLLCASAALGNASRPCQRFIPRRHLNNRKPTNNSLCLKQRSL